jgi:hypothetical protein
VTAVLDVKVLARKLHECRDDPDLFNRRFLNRDGKQRFDPNPATRQYQYEICKSVVQYRTTVVYSGNMLGKDFVFARLILWWLYTRPGSLVIVTGPTQQQIGSIVWKEVRRAIKNAVIPFSDHVTAAVQASPQQVQLGDGWQALGFSTKSVERASGQHAGELLVLVIEGSGVEEEIWDAIESLGYDRLCVNGNPLRAEGRFVDLVRQAEKDKRDGIPSHMAVNAIQISSLESPHADLDKSPVGLADKTWLAAIERKYGAKSMWYRSHVLAIIPEVSADILIPENWLDFLYAHQRKTLRPDHPIHLTRRLACDLGEGVGRDSSCVLVRDDFGVLDCVYGSALGLPQAAQKMWELGRKWKIPPQRMSYDKLGIGRNFPNHLAKLGLAEARPYAGSGSPIDSQFADLRTEAAWKLRNRLDVQHAPDIRAPHIAQEPFSFVPGLYQERLRDEIRPLTYEFRGGRTCLLAKDKWAEILGHSPDIADTLIQSFAHAA